MTQAKILQQQSSFRLSYADIGHAARKSGCLDDDRQTRANVVIFLANGEFIKQFTKR